MPAGDPTIFREGDLPTSYTAWTNWTGSTTAVTDAFNGLSNAVGNLTNSVGNMTNAAISAWTYWTLGTDNTAHYVQPAPGMRVVEPDGLQALRLTPEQEALRAEVEERQRLERERRNREFQEHERQKAEAKSKARALLLENLTTEQAEEYLRDEAFHIMAANGKRYKIRKGMVSNIDELDDAGKRVRGYCVHIQAGVECPPDEDNLLAQVLFLRTDPQALLSRANIVH